MSSKSIFLLINLAGLAAVSFVFVTNGAPCTLSLFGAAVSLSPGLIALIFYVAGVALCAASGSSLLRGSQEKGIEKLKEWQRQDAKLQIEVQSDKEKQLEAKIATLEAALKQALKK